MLFRHSTVNLLANLRQCRFVRLPNAGIISQPLATSDLSTMRHYSSHTTSEQFAKAVKDLKKLKEEPPNDIKLKLYGLYKQATEGDVHGDRPKMFDFVARAKFDAWQAVKGSPEGLAEFKYVQFVNLLLEEAGIDPDSSDAAPSSKESVANVAESDGLRLAKEGKVFRIELNRPDKFNAITWEMYEGLISALGEANADRETSVTLMTGVGAYYCAGNDLSNFFRGVKTGDDLRAMADRGQDVLQRYVRSFIEHDKPLIGLINGPAIGISVTVLALFDLVIASDKVIQ
uniref:ACB domain-containing protein n=1 Tax=Globodera rostochiensis TaxID=31243 RepID=A0A914IBU4_GLORO